MNIFLWVLQVLLALHTVMGAVWKLGNSTEVVPSLRAIPHGGWIALSVVEVLLAVMLVLPAMAPKYGKLVVYAAIGIALEMVLFSVVTLVSGEPDTGSQIVYWMVVAAVCAFIAYGRMKLRPI